MKATRIFPSSPSWASGGIGAEQNKCSCVSISLDEETHDLPADKAWRVPPSSPPVCYSFSSLSFACFGPCHLQVQMSGTPRGHVLRQHGILPQFSRREPQAASFGILETIA